MHKDKLIDITTTAAAAATTTTTTMVIYTILYLPSTTR